MRAGIIAAGEGSRFQRAGVSTPKPLLEVGGMTLMERTIRNLVAGGVTEVAYIVNDAISEVVLPRVQRMVQETGLQVDLRPLVKTTESSMHSVHELGKVIGDQPFVLCTVDSIMLPSDATGFIKAFGAGVGTDLDLLLSYTDFIDDEKPLYIAINEPNQRVTALGDEAKESPYCTMGLYGLTPKVLPQLQLAVDRGVQKLRNYLGLVLQDDDKKVNGFRLSKAVDVDRPEDREVAEAFCKEHGLLPSMG
jgi:choline kinase